MRDNYSATCEVLKTLLKSTKGININIIGRLIEQNYVTLLLKRKGKVKDTVKFITFGGEVLSVESLSVSGWLTCIALAFLVIPIDMIRKAIMHKK